MYITLSNIQNGGYIPLNPTIDTRAGRFDLAKILYYNRWTNISTELGNNQFRYGKTLYTTEDGYNVCDLHKHYFVPLKIELSMNSVTDLVTIGGIKERLFLGALGPVSGFEKI